MYMINKPFVNKRELIMNNSLIALHECT